jgi:hypothetical protein
MPKYPNLKLVSKPQLIKRLTGKTFKDEKKLEETKDLLEYCLGNFDKLWKDNLKQSDSKKGK